MMERYVAIKVRTSDIIHSELKKDEIGKYLQLGNIKARRLHFVGVVSNSYFNTETQLAFFKITPFRQKPTTTKPTTTTVQESTGEISVRFFRDDFKRAENIDGYLVRVIGKIKEFQGEKYILGEIITDITVLDAELFRADIISISGKPVEKQVTVTESSNGGVEEQISQYIKDNSGKDGIKYTALISAFCENGDKEKIPEDTLDKILSDLLTAGIIFEPKIGKFKEIK